MCCVHRAFGFDRRVLELNWRIHWDNDFPQPYLLSTLIRFVTTPVKMLAARFLWVVKFFFRCVKKCILCCHTTVDTDNGAAENEGAEEKSAMEQALLDFRQKVENQFGNSARIDDLMAGITEYTSGR